MPAAVPQDHGGAGHERCRHRLQLPLRRISGDDPMRSMPTSPVASTAGARGRVHTFPNEGTAKERWFSQPGDIVILPYCRYVVDPVQLGDPRRVTSSALKAVSMQPLMRDWLAEDCKDRRQTTAIPYAVSHLGWGLIRRPLGLASLCYGDAPERHPRRGAHFPGQLPVLDRPQHAGRRQARRRGPLRRADARLHHLVHGRTVVENGRVVDAQMQVARVAR